jgi:hypothetical protein
MYECGSRHRILERLILSITEWKIRRSGSLVLLKEQPAAVRYLCTVQVNYNAMFADNS